MKTLTLKQTGYTIKGTADLTCWGGGNASITMESFNLDRLSIKAIKENLNDNGFGVEKINGAICEVFENYQGVLEHIKTVEVGEVSESTRESHLNNF